MKPRLFVFAVSAMLLASCGAPTAESSQAPAVSSEPASSSVAPIAKKLTGISLDTTNVKKAYLFNSLMPSTLNDELDATGLKVIANYDDGTTSEIATSEVLVTGPDLGAVGEGEVTVTYRGKQATYPVKVGSYKATAADIALAGDKVIVTITGSYEGLTAEEFKAFSWSADFQENGYNGGSWDGGWAEKADEAVVMNAENGVFTYTRDVTALENKLYTGHFGHKLVPNNNGGMQKMDLKIDAEDATKSVTFNNRVYTINYNIGKDQPDYCWGNLSLTIADEGAPSWAVNSIALSKEEGHVYLAMNIGFENYTNDAFLALPWYIDFQNNDNIGGGGWATVLKEEALASKMTIAGNVASFKLDVTSLAAGGYTMHFGLKTGDGTPEYKPATWAAQDALVDGDKSYHLVCTPGSSEGTEFWGCVGLMITQENPPAAAISAASIAKSGDDVVLTLSGTGENIDNTMFRADIQKAGDDWATTALTSDVTVNEGAWTIAAHIPASVGAQNYLVHWFLGSASHDLEKKSDSLADFASSSVVANSKNYELHIVNMWDRDMICVTISDVA